MELQKYYEWLQLNKNSQKTIKTYYQMVNCFGKCCEYKFNQENLDKYIIKLKEENKSPNTINIFRNAFKSYMDFSELKLVIPKKAKVKKRAIKYYFTEKDLKHILKSYYDEKDLILRFLFFTGARPSELRELKKDHINFNTRDIIFYNAKGNKDRVIPVLNDDMFNRLKKHCDRLSDDKVFKTTYCQLTAMFKKIKIDLDINEHEIVEPRTMRISFAKYCVSIGMNILYLKKLMGHSDIKITELYAEPDSRMIKEFCEKIRKEK